MPVFNAAGPSGWQGLWRRGSARADCDECAALPLPHRLALVYLALPVVVWLVGWFEWWVGPPLAALLALALAPALRGRWRLRATRVGVGVALAMLALTMLLPAGGYFGAETQDWLNHRGHLLDLGRGDWPTRVALYGHDGAAPLLRYHLGYHIVPGLLGKWLGAWALNWFVPFWTWAGLALLALLFVRGLPTLRAALLAVVVGMVLFSGMDALAYVLREGPVDGALRFWERVRSRQSPIFLITPEHPTLLDYFPLALQLRNSPHHVLAAGLGAMLLLPLRAEPRFVGIAGLCVVLCGFTSLLATLGLVPLGACLFWRARPRWFLTWRNLLVAPLLAGVLALYYASGETRPHGWLWQVYDSDWAAVRDMLVLYLTEFALIAALVWRLRPGVMRDPFFVAALLVLLAVPWYWYGDPDFSESTLRVPLAALFVLAYYTARVVTGGAAAQRGDAVVQVAPRRCRVWFALLLGVLGVGALSALAEYGNMLRRPGWLPYEESHLTLALVNIRGIEQRTVPELPPLLAALLREQDGEQDRRRPHGKLVLQADYHVYQLGRIFVFVRKACDIDFERTTRFFVRGVGVGAAGRSPPLIDLDFGVLPGHMRRGRPCVHWRRLPTAAPARLRIGQSVPGEGVVWEAEVGFDGDATSSRMVRERATFFAARYRALREAAGSAPAVRSRFDAHLAGRDLVFVKNPCVAADTMAKFLVHVFAADVESLPAHRRRHGFDNRDFHFGQRGAFGDSGCATAAALPAYPIQRLRIGQLGQPAGAGVLWQADIDFGNRPYGKASGR